MLQSEIFLTDIDEAKTFIHELKDPEAYFQHKLDEKVN